MAEFDSQSRMPQPLSTREEQIIRLAAQGLTDNAISHRLAISLATVGTYWGRIRVKLGPLNRTELVANYLRAESDQTLADLQEANLALRARLDEVESDRKLFQTLIDAAPDPMIVVDRTGRILLGNTAAIDLFGYESQILTRLQVTDLMPERYRVKHSMHRNDYFAHPERKAMGGPRWHGCPRCRRQ